MSRVQDIIHNREFFSVDLHQSVADVARRMAELRVGAILVLEGDELRGIFSERDLMMRVVVARLEPEQTPVGSVMSTELATIDETATIEQAMELMGARNCRHLPVMSGGKLVGFLSMRDVMHHDLATKTEELHHMRAYINGAV